jgi:DNA-binding response OmpR family regulator
VNCDPELAERPVVILTAGDVAETEAEALEARASAFLTKPFGAGAILATVTALVGD